MCANEIWVGNPFMKMDYLIFSDQPVLPDEPYAGRGVRRIHKYRAGQV